MDTLQILIATKDEALREILMALLGEAGYDAFEENDTALLAYITSAEFSAAGLEEIIRKFGLSYTQKIIPQQNWNSVWEASYEPVVIDDFCIVRAQFHAPAKGFEHEIIITPKMSFGTGHHATTKAMIGAMRELDFKNREVLDFGAGTGILAILAAKLGAANVLAIDHEEWAAKNAEENVGLNAITNVRIAEGSFDEAGDRNFDIILANINRHILLTYMPEMLRALKQKGQLLLSGILADDECIITTAAVKESLELQKRYEQSGWLALLFGTSKAPERLP